jgi:hypothetical protein
VRVGRVPPSLRAHSVIVAWINLRIEPTYAHDGEQARADRTRHAEAGGSPSQTPCPPRVPMTAACGACASLALPAAKRRGRVWRGRAQGQSGRGPARWCAGSPLAVSAVSSFVPV